VGKGVDIGFLDRVFGVAVPKDAARHAVETLVIALHNHTKRVRIPGTSAHRADLLEQPAERLAFEDGEVVVAFRPWEIVTLMVV